MARRLVTVTVIRAILVSGPGAPARPSGGGGAAERAGDLGDVLLALACVAHSTGVDLQQAVESALIAAQETVGAWDDRLDAVKSS